MAVRKNSSTSRRARVRYASFAETLRDQRFRLANPREESERLQNIINESQALFKSFAASTRNSRIIHMDQVSFKETTGVVYERMRNQMRDESSELSLAALIASLRNKVVSSGSGTAVLEQMGSTYVENSQTAVLSPRLPQLGAVVRTQSTRHSHLRNDRPTGPVSGAQTTGEAELRSDAERNFQRAKEQIVAAVRNFQELHPQEELPIHRLAFDKYSFVRTIENFFNLSTLVHDKVLYVTANSDGLPIVRLHLSSSSQDPTSLLPGSRQQFNHNLNAEIFELLKEAYGEDEPMVPRTDYDNETMTFN